jgi:hypothetical protein
LVLIVIGYPLSVIRRESKSKPSSFYHE